MSDENNFSKKGERKISSFIGQELLYDYITEQLDPEREKAVKEFLDNNREAQGDITKINNGIAYVERMSETVVSQPLIEQIKQPSSYLEVVLMKIRFDQWPQGLRLGLEALLVAVGITCIALILPWHKIMSLKIGGTDVILTEVSHNDRTQENSSEMTAKEEAPEFTDEGTDQEVAATATAASKPTVTPIKPVVTPTVKPTPSPVAAATPAKTPAPSTAPSGSEGAVAANVAGEVATPAESKRQGYLYRATIDVTNVTAVSAKLAERIAELGGRKAGDVELGWKRGDGSYFHFTIPESKYQDILTLFGEYGQLKINKEKHERIMPEGIIRLIINVDEKKSGT